MLHKVILNYKQVGCLPFGFYLSTFFLLFSFDDILIWALKKVFVGSLTFSLLLLIIVNIGKFTFYFGGMLFKKTVLCSL